MPLEVQFTKIRDIEERQFLLKRDFEKHNKWILSGSLCSWGDMFIPHFELVIYLWIPRDIRISRLVKREKEDMARLLNLEGTGMSHLMSLLNGLQSMIKPV